MLPMQIVPEGSGRLILAQRTPNRPYTQTRDFQGRLRPFVISPLPSIGLEDFHFRSAILPQIEETYFTLHTGVFSKLIHHVPYTEKKLQPLQGGKFPCLCLTILWLEFREVWPK